MFIMQGGNPSTNVYLHLNNTNVYLHFKFQHCILNFRMYHREGKEENKPMSKSSKIQSKPNQSKENQLAYIEETRMKLIEQINNQCDALIEQISTNGNLGLFTFTLSSLSPAQLKGKKPVSLEFSNHEMVKTPTWKKVVETILKDVNNDPIYHQALLEFNGKCLGKQRAILNSTPESMDVPIEIDENIFFEAKYDTETLIRVLTERVLKPIGYKYEDIKLTYKV